MDRAGYMATWRDDWFEAAGVIARYVGIADPTARIAPAQHREAA
jgi:hypothetical protein